jgi:small subunit ribosomal protein S21
MLYIGPARRELGSRRGILPLLRLVPVTGHTNRVMRRSPAPCGAIGLSAIDLETNEGRTLQVFVRDNNVDQALKALKKKMQREGIFREMKSRRSYEKPSEKRARERAEAVRRARKLARKQAQREGLLPGKKRSARG